MTSVRIEVLVDDPTRDDVDTVMDCAPGSEVVDACDATGAPIDFSCRAACCSTCRVEILQGAELLAPPDAMEQELIDASDGDRAVRYCCVMRVADDAPEGAVARIRPLGPAF
jgi:ferredoxin